MQKLSHRICFSILEFARWSPLRLEDETFFLVSIASVGQQALTLEFRPGQLDRSPARLKAFLRCRQPIEPWQSNYIGWARLAGRRYQIGLRFSYDRTQATVFLRPLDLHRNFTGAQLEVLQ